MADIAVPRSIDRAVNSRLTQAIPIDLGLLTLFAVQHSVMARPAFKRWWTLQTRSLPAIVWDVDWLPARAVPTTVGWAGWAVVLASTFMINHFELFGLQQVFGAWRARPLDDNGFRTVLFYRLVRHPLMLKFLLAFWSGPRRP